MDRSAFFRRSCSLGILLILLSLAVVPAAAEDAGKNYLVMYIIGSDLETEWGSASTNLYDLVFTWDPAMGDIVVIYGGAKKTGWDDGVAITNLELLREDFADGVIGSDLDEDGNGEPTRYVLTRIPETDISTPQALGASLQYAEQYRKSAGLTGARQYLIFWNHGSGYCGYGSNEISGKILSLNDLRTGLAGAGTTYDLIGFDACLMGSLEVANALNPYAAYLLASEEIVPGCGYDYTAFAELSASPGMSPRDMGSHLISYFIAQPDQTKTLSLVQLSRVPAVVAALNTFGEKLAEVTGDEGSLETLGDIYRNTQGFGKDTWLYGYSMDLYEFAYNVRDLTDEDSDLHAAADALLTAVQNYVVRCADDGHFSAARGVSVAAPTEQLLSGIPEELAFGEGGWYLYLSSYISSAGVASQPHAAYTDARGARPIQVTDSTGTARVSANYLYQNAEGRYLIVGDVPLEVLRKPANNSVWTTIPTGMYAEPEWDGTWFVFRNADGTVLPATLVYKGPAVSNNRSLVIYTVTGNLTRIVNGTPATHSSILTLRIDEETRTVQDIAVTEKPDTLWDTRSNVWGNTTLLSGDVFTPDLQIYDHDNDTVTVAISPQSVTFGSSPAESLIFTTLDPDRCFWMVELDDFLDDDVFYLEEPGLGEAAPKMTQTPAGMAGIFAVLLLAGVLRIKR